MLICCLLSTWLGGRVGAPMFDPYLPPSGSRESPPRGDNLFDSSFLCYFDEGKVTGSAVLSDKLVRTLKSNLFQELLELKMELNG